jgi:hypothetical protein
MIPHVSSPADQKPGKPHFDWLRFPLALFFATSLLSLATLVAGAEADPQTLSHKGSEILWSMFAGAGLVAGVLGWLWWRLAGRVESSTPTDRGAAADLAGALHAGPNLSAPTQIFADGGFVYQLEVTPALFPPFLTRDDGMLNPGARLFQLILGGVTFVAVRPLDRRYKMFVSRRAFEAGRLWRVVQLEFFGSTKGAEARAMDVLKNWDSATYAALEPLTTQQQREERRRKQGPTM